MSDDVTQHGHRANDVASPMSPEAPELTASQARTLARLVWGGIGAVLLIAAVFVVAHRGFGLLITIILIGLIATQPSVMSGIDNLVRDERRVGKVRAPHTREQLSRVPPRLRREASSTSYQQYLNSLRGHGWTPGSGEPASYLYMRRRGK